MNEFGSDLSEFQSLMLDWESGELDDSGISRLREILKTDAAARENYVRHQMISAAMKLDADANLVPQSFESSLDESEPKASTNYFSSYSFLRSNKFWAAAAAILLICSLAGRVFYLESSSFKNEAVSLRNESEEATSSGVAIVTRMVGVEFAESDNDLEIGDALPPGKLAIDSGFAQIEFFCGATLIVEGPADIDLVSSSLARIRSGKVRAQVPPAARGFSVEVDDMTVVDLGTEFGISVSSDGADVQVFDGEVEVHAPETEMQLLTAGQAVLRRTDGDFVSTEVTPDRFLDVDSLESRARDQRTARFEAWNEWVDGISNDPRLIAFYSFSEEGTKGRKLRSSIRPENNELDGAIVGARPVVGRWPAKSGLEFKHPGDRVRVNIPGEFKSLTFSCWVKIDSLDRWYNSLFLTDSYNQGEPHWQILDTGQLFFSVRHKTDDFGGTQIKGPTHQEVLSKPFWKPSMSGKWLHLATSYDASTGTTKHYLNGEVLHKETIAKELLVETTRIGAASICNWSIPIKPDAEYAIRNLNGSIDEFIIMSSALSDDEIKEIFENGKP